MKIEFDTEKPMTVLVDGKSYHVTKVHYDIDPTYESLEVEWIQDFRFAKMLQKTAND